MSNVNLEIPEGESGSVQDGNRCIVYTCQVRMYVHTHTHNPAMRLTHTHTHTHTHAHMHTCTNRMVPLGSLPLQWYSLVMILVALDYLKNEQKLHVAVDSVMVSCPSPLQPATPPLSNQPLLPLPPALPPCYVAVD